MADWRVLDRIMELHTRWFALRGERLQTEAGEVLEYWRVERPDSVVILPLQDASMLLPAPVYRPGVGAATLDFPGGRVPANTSPAAAARAILVRELGIDDAQITALEPLNDEGWPVDSSFSSQRLFAMVAELAPSTQPAHDVRRVPANAAGVATLARELTCLQCRAVLREWQLRSGCLTASPTSAPAGRTPPRRA